MPSKSMPQRSNHDLMEKYPYVHDGHTCIRAYNRYLDKKQLFFLSENTKKTHVDIKSS